MVCTRGVLGLESLDSYIRRRGNLVSQVRQTRSYGHCILGSSGGLVTGVLRTLISRR